MSIFGGPPRASAFNQASTNFLQQWRSGLGLIIGERDRRDRQQRSDRSYDLQKANFHLSVLKAGQGKSTISEGADGVLHRRYTPGINVDSLYDNHPNVFPNFPKPNANAITTPGDLAQQENAFVPPVSQPTPGDTILAKTALESRAETPQTPTDSSGLVSLYPNAEDITVDPNAVAADSPDVPSDSPANRRNLGVALPSAARRVGDHATVGGTGSVNRSAFNIANYPNHLRRILRERVNSRKEIANDIEKNPDNYTRQGDTLYRVQSWGNNQTLTPIKYDESDPPKLTFKTFTDKFGNKTYGKINKEGQHVGTVYDPAKALEDLRYFPEDANVSDMDFGGARMWQNIHLLGKAMESVPPDQMYSGLDEDDKPIINWGLIDGFMHAIQFRKDPGRQSQVMHSRLPTHPIQLQQLGRLTSEYDRMIQEELKFGQVWNDIQREEAMEMIRKMIIKHPEENPAMLYAMGIGRMQFHGEVKDQSSGFGDFESNFTPKQAGLTSQTGDLRFRLGSGSFTFGMNTEAKDMKLGAENFNPDAPEEIPNYNPQFMEERQPNVDVQGPLAKEWPIRSKQLFPKTKPFDTGSEGQFSRVLDGTLPEGHKVRQKVLASGMNITESRLHTALKDMNILNAKSQFQISKMRTDFAFEKEGLVVEVNGPYHDTDSGKATDDKRLAALQDRQYERISFTAIEVYQNPHRVARAISAKLKQMRTTMDSHEGRVRSQRMEELKYLGESQLENKDPDAQLGNTDPAAQMRVLDWKNFMSASNAIDKAAKSKNKSMRKDPNESDVFLDLTEKKKLEEWAARKIAREVAGSLKKNRSKKK